MLHEDSRLNGNRKNMGSKYGDSSGNYSPSTSYNYSPGSSNYPSSQHQSHPRRRSDRFKRESLNQTDRLAKQNDVIIRLLKEIRDRLPARSVPYQGDHVPRRQHQPDSAQRQMPEPENVTAGPEQAVEPADQEDLQGNQV